MPDHINKIKLGAQVLKVYYNEYAELFNKIRDGYKKLATESFARDYKAFLKLSIQKLPNKDIQHYSEQEKRDALSTLVNINSRSSEFQHDMFFEKWYSGIEFNEAEEEIVRNFEDAVELIIDHSDPYHDRWKLPHT